MVRRKKITKFLSNDDTVLPDILDNEEEGHRGENITPKSPLFRREFDKRDIFAVAYNKG
jgi:hypothetical protein